MFVHDSGGTLLADISSASASHPSAVVISAWSIAIAMTPDPKSYAIERDCRVVGVLARLPSGQGALKRPTADSRGGLSEHLPFR
jgi:hypothetical protein